jgi:two-component system, cell cycle sensor histidine kinase and response regulator CckA
MEAVGRLAGGVAHDFNNLLTIINGNLGFARDDLGPGHPVQDDLAQVAQAADRAQALVRQLLAFGRQQVLQPRRVDVNDSVRRVAAMLRRVIGEDVVLDQELGAAGAVHVDPGQLEQVVMNLAVNARDALPNGGTIRLRTAAVEIGAAESDAWPGLAPGRYATLVVEDTGIGIDPTVRTRVFDPFFTTKGPGKGTGLGLATVHGIVQQSGGGIAVESAVGLGSRFTVLLPSSDAADADATEEGAAPMGRGTVLLVEDERAVRGVVRRQLERAGYAVREAASGAEALRLVLDGADPIDVVLTDVVMPEQNGRVLAERIARIRPELRVVFMSGYTDDEIVRRGLLTPGAVLLQKPFTPEALAAAIGNARGD